MKQNEYESSYNLGIGRIYEQINDAHKSFMMYKKVLLFDNNNIEAIASIANYHFYTD